MINIMTKNKKGVSAVIGTVILIALTIGVVAIVWAVVSNLVEENISSSESCFGVFGKVTLNPRYTCYNNTAGAGADELWFSISVGDIEKVDDILVAISGGGSSTIFKILEDSPAGLSYYPNRTQPVGIPGKNSGFTYIYELPASFAETPERIEIALIINGEVCGNIDSIEQFDSCSLLA
ncbi:MAG TPA: hypothetical protein VJ142_02210 [Candidatus Nanoarchaeia archaeon]|nr:hypothetical protein [Candidatus Nanoarchaeia archaeon]